MTNQKTSGGTAANSEPQPIVNSSADIEANPLLVAVYVMCVCCEWQGNLIECGSDTEPDLFKDKDREYPICPKCGGGVE